MSDCVMEFVSDQEASGGLPFGVGVAASVVEDGEAILTHTVGWRERDRSLPVTPDTRFEIGSLTKAFTAAAILIARERRLIDLDRPINSSEQLLALSDEEVARRISIADILCHRTGMPAHDLLWYFRRVDRRTLIATLSHLELVPGAFRRAFSYSNLMYAALGHLFADLAGHPYESFVVERVLRPVAMNATTFDISDGEGDVALPYAGTQRIARADVSAIAAAGGLKSTLQDMARWVRWQLTAYGNHDLMSADSLALMRSRHMQAGNVNPILLRGLEWLGDTLDYGFGWFLGSTQGLTVAFHPALIDGFSHAVALVPERKFGVVVMMNTNLSPAPGLLMQQVLTRALQPPAGETADADNHPSPLQRLVLGTYENDVYGMLRIKLVRDRLVLEYVGTDWPLTWSGEGKAVVEVPAFGVRIPLSVEFGGVAGTTRQVSIAMSLDGRVPPEVFTRLPA